MSIGDEICILTEEYILWGCIHTGYRAVVFNKFVEGDENADGVVSDQKTPNSKTPTRGIHA